MGRRTLNVSLERRPSKYISYLITLSTALVVEFHLTLLKITSLVTPKSNEAGCMVTAAAIIRHELERLPLKVTRLVWFAAVVP
jgi:hypothetical protein